jgi:hypothetical protein
MTKDNIGSCFCLLQDLSSSLLAFKAGFAGGGMCAGSTNFHAFNHAFADHLQDDVNI